MISSARCNRQTRRARAGRGPRAGEVPLFPKLRKVFEQFVSELDLEPDDFLCLSERRVGTLMKLGVDFERP